MVVENWKSMDTAPKDGRVIMVYSPGAKVPAMVFWSAEYSTWVMSEYEDLVWALECVGYDFVIGASHNWKLGGWDYLPAVPLKVTE